MNEAASFLAAICASPSDVASRLVFADWLMERDDPRGEFIAVQCRLAELPSYDPARPDLQERERALLQQHRGVWDRELALPEGDDRPGLEYRRGFVEVVAGYPEQIARLPAHFPQRTPLCEVQPFLTGGMEGLDLVEQAAALPALAWFSELTIAGFDSMHCSGNHLAAEQLGILLQSPHLSSLTALRLSENELQAEAGPILAGWPGLAGVSELVLSGNPLRAGFRGVAESPYLSRLTHLDLSQTGLDLEGLAALARAPGAAGLTTLNLSGCPCGAEGGRILAGASFAGNLERLDLSHGGLGDAGLIALLEGLRRGALRSLSLPWNCLTSAAARALATCPGARTLTTLHLRGNCLGPEGMAALLDSPYCGRWVDLSISGRIDSFHEEDKTTREVTVPNVGAAGVRRLLASPAAASLLRLDLRHNNLDARDLLALAESPHLEGIGLLDVAELSLDPARDPEAAAAVATLRKRFGERVLINHWISDCS